MTRAMLMRKHMWLAAVAAGLVLVGVGGFFVTEGFAAKNMIETALVAEEATTAGDAVIPGAAIVNLATAEAQADAITNHTLGQLGPYGALEREDPNRDVYLDGLTLRNALNVAVMGFKVADLVMGVGALFILLGMANVMLLAPVLFWMRQPEHETREATTEREVVGTMRGQRPTHGTV